jgi:hypothetical protein
MNLNISNPCMYDDTGKKLLWYLWRFQGINLWKLIKRKFMQPFLYKLYVRVIKQLMKEKTFYEKMLTKAERIIEFENH